MTAKNDLQSDLLADLQGAASARPLPVSAPGVPDAVVAELRRPTPTVEVRITPLRWSRPRVAAGELRVGPVQVSLTSR